MTRCVSPWAIRNQPRAEPDNSAAMVREELAQLRNQRGFRTLIPVASASGLRVDANPRRQQFVLIDEVGPDNAVYDIDRGEVVVIDLG